MWARDLRAWRKKEEDDGQSYPKKMESISKRFDNDLFFAKTTFACGHVDQSFGHSFSFPQFKKMTLHIQRCFGDFPSFFLTKTTWLFSPAQAPLSAREMPFYLRFPPKHEREKKVSWLGRQTQKSLSAAGEQQSNAFFRNRPPVLCSPLLRRYATLPPPPPTLHFPDEIWAPVGKGVHTLNLRPFVLHSTLEWKIHKLAKMEYPKFLFLRRSRFSPSQIFLGTPDFFCQLVCWANSEKVSPPSFCFFCLLGWLLACFASGRPNGRG